jgi:uncharacterized protein
MKEMRRKDREIIDRKEIDEIIAKADVLHLAMADGNIPYVVPLSFGYDGKHIYFHCAKEGLKLDFIKKNPNVCFALVGCVKYQSIMTSCNAGTKFMSVIGRGTCEILADIEEKKKGLDILMSHYTKSKIEYPLAALQTTIVVKITITELKGKKRM